MNKNCTKLNFRVTKNTQFFYFHIIFFYAIKLIYFLIIFFLKKIYIQYLH